MRVTEALMRPGGWSLTMKPDAPQSIVDALRDRVATWDATNNRWTPVLDGQIVVFDTETTVPSLDTARYAGILNEQTGSRSFAGPGLLAYMQTDGGMSPVLRTEPETVAAQSLSAWITDLSGDGWNGLTSGSVTNTGLSNTGLTIPTGVGQREILDAVCRRMGAEYRVNADGTVDAASATTLFTDTPDVVVTDRPTGEAGTPRGIAGYALSASVDASNVGSHAVGYGASLSAVSATAAVTIGKGLGGGTLTYRRAVDLPDAETATEASAAATVTRDLFRYPRSSFSIQSTGRYVRRSVEPGDWVWVWFPDAGIRGGAAVTFRGETIFPHKVRVSSMSWGVHDGCGVFLRRKSGSTETWTDLTDHVEMSAPSAMWKVGTDGGATDRTGLTGVARLGDDEPVEPVAPVGIPTKGPGSISRHTGKVRH